MWSGTSLRVECQPRGRDEEGGAQTWCANSAEEDRVVFLQFFQPAFGNVSSMLPVVVATPVKVIEL